MSHHPYRADTAITARLVSFVLGEVSVNEFEAWVYDTPELESVLSPDDYLALISLNYRRSDAERAARHIARRYADMAEVEAQALRRMLTAILEGGAPAFDAAIHAYEQYCRGYDFLDDLGLGFGLSFLDAADREELSDARKQEIAARSASALAHEAQRVIGWLDTGLLRPTGRAVHYRIMGYIDRRSDNDRRPTSYTRVEVEMALPGLSLWDQIKKGLGMATTPERLARDRFRMEHPGEHVAWVRLAADEPARFVVAIYFGTAIPPRMCFYEVTKTAQVIRRLRNDAAYRPALWR